MAVADLMEFISYGKNQHGYGLGNELHHYDVRRVGEAGGSPASGFGCGNFA